MADQTFDDGSDAADVADTAGTADDAGPSDAADVRPDPGCCTASHNLSEGDVAADVETLSALGNDTRYEALRLIAAAEDALCVCEIEPALGVSQGAVSQGLSKLADAGLVDCRTEGRWRYYFATPRAERLLGVLDDTRDETGGADDD